MYDTTTEQWLERTATATAERINALDSLPVKAWVLERMPDDDVAVADLMRAGLCPDCAADSIVDSAIAALN